MSELPNMNVPIDAARNHRRRLVGVPKRAADLVSEYRQERLALEQRRDLFGIPRREARHALQETFLDKEEALSADFDDAHAGLLGATSRARHSLSDVDPLAWERLKSSIADKDGLDAQDSAMARLKRAEADGDEAMLVAGAIMLGDHLTALGGELMQHNADWLDAAAGGESAAEAVALEHESRTGVPWVTTALGFVRLEIERDSNGPASILPTYERDVLIEPGSPPDYGAAAERAASEAGVRVGTR